MQISSCKSDMQTVITNQDSLVDAKRSYICTHYTQRKLCECRRLSCCRSLQPPSALPLPQSFVSFPSMLEHVKIRRSSSPQGIDEQLISCKCPLSVFT